MSRAEEYTSRIYLTGGDEQKLNRILEQAAFDDEITNAEYCALFSHAEAVLKEAGAEHIIVSL